MRQLTRLVAKGLFVAVGSAVVGLSSPVGSAHAEPGVLCDHRGMEHVKRHGGQLADDAYHRSRSENVTCSSDTSGGNGEFHLPKLPVRDKHRWYRND